MAGINYIDESKYTPRLKFKTDGMKKLYFKETQIYLTDPCPFGVNAMVGSINCQQCPRCLAMNDRNNWVICEKFNEKKEDNEKTN